MPYTAAHKRETRRRIVASARRLFNRNGFDGVSIDEIMADAGLTRGGFYKHFGAKDELYRDAVLQFAEAESPEPWQALHVDAAASGVRLARMIVNAYLSKEHFEDRDGSCPMVALPSDIGRTGAGARAAFREVLEMLVGSFEANLAPAQKSPRERALALAATMVGGMVLARAVDDPALGDAIRDAARAQVFATAGWEAE